MGINESVSAHSRGLKTINVGGSDSSKPALTAMFSWGHGEAEMDVPHCTPERKCSHSVKSKKDSQTHD